MEDSKTIEKIMKTVEENLELSVNICYEYGFISTGDALNKALVALADAKLTREYEESQKLDLAEIEEARLNSIKDTVEPILSVEEAKEMVDTFNNVGSEESNGC